MPGTYGYGYSPVRTPRAIGGGRGSFGATSVRRREVYSATGGLGREATGGRAKIQHGGEVPGFRTGGARGLAGRMGAFGGAVALTGEWDAAMGWFRTFSSRLEQALNRGQERACLLLVRTIKQGLESGHPVGGQPFTPLHWFTIQEKGNDRPMIEQGQLLESIDYRKVGFQSWFVGISRGEVHHSGFKTVELATILEEGALIPVTMGMHTYLASKGFVLSPQTQYIHIPARPFLRPPIENRGVQEQMIKEISSEVIKVMSKVRV
jgi:hypothetical protein